MPTLNLPTGRLAHDLSAVGMAAAYSFFGTSVKAKNQTRYLFITFGVKDTKIKMKPFSIQLTSMLPAPYKRFARLLTNNILHLRATHLTIFFAIISLQANSQLAKKTWLVGGSGSFLASKHSYSSPNYSSSSDRLETSLSANVGYFILEKLAIGIKPGFTKFKDGVDGPGGGYSNQNRLYIGPFVRYYFLNSDKDFNILTDLSFQHGFYWFTPTKGNINIFSFSSGPIVYFNSSVGIEFLLGYYSKKEIIKQNGEFIDKQTGFRLDIGFQISLIR
ncbi:MAG: hypothetical protein R2796_08025 [Chitinophagaceae bacterium]